MQDKTTGTIRRITKIWSAIIIALGVLVFIMEIFEAVSTELGPYPFYENLIPLTLFTGVVGLALAWRWEALGGAITVISVATNFGTYLATGREAVSAVALILAPILIPGVLFLVCWAHSRGEAEARTV